MKTPKLLLASICVVLFSCSVQGQGNFVNLNFEASTLATLPPGTYGSEVSSTDAIPGWSAFLDTNEVTQVLQNNLTLGNASISILGPHWSFPNIIEGQYTLVLQPGAGSGGLVSASVSQTGLVPLTAQSLEFKAFGHTPFSVSLGGQALDVVALGSGANYFLYGASIPGSYAGQPASLTITALAGPNSADYFDSCAFLSSPIPEPGILGILFTGLLVLTVYLGKTGRIR